MKDLSKYGIPTTYRNVGPPSIINLEPRRAVVDCNFYPIDSDVTFEDLENWVKKDISEVEKVIEPEKKEWQVPSSKGDKKYTVTFNNGSWYCECSGFGFRKHCRHVDDVKKSLNIS
jgi:hypothetical protein